MSDDIWWYLTRAAALVSWWMALASIVLGLLLSSKMMGRRPGFPWLLDLHRFTSGLAVGFALLHMGTLWVHDFIEFDLVDLLIPGASSWDTTAVAFGVVAFWAMAVVQASSLLKNHIPKKVWHGTHLLSYLVAITVTVHAATAGTDWSNLAFQLMAVVMCSLIVGLTAVRLGAHRLAQGKRARRAATLERAKAGPEPTPPVVDAAPRRRSLADRHAEAAGRRS
ncbi:MAG: hypothetical protein ACRBI6_08280 [Acidimicrobiales bacterium]